MIDINVIKSAIDADIETFVSTVYWCGAFDVSNMAPKRWIISGELPPPLGRFTGKYAWWRADAERYLKILQEQTDTEPPQTKTAKRRQAVQRLMAEKAQKTTELETA